MGDWEAAGTLQHAGRGGAEIAQLPKKELSKTTVSS